MSFKAAGNWLRFSSEPEHVAWIKKKWMNFFYVGEHYKVVLSYLTDRVYF